MMRPWLTIALAVVATAEDEAVAAYVRFARTTLPKLEKAWAAPHRADPVKQGKRGRVLLLTFPNSGTSYTIRAAECLADSQMCSSYIHECEKSRIVGERPHHPFLDRNPELISFQGGRMRIRDPAKLEKAMALYFNGRPAEQLVEFQAVWKLNCRRPTPSTQPNSLVDFHTGSKPASRTSRRRRPCGNVERAPGC